MSSQSAGVVMMCVGSQRSWQTRACAGVCAELQCTHSMAEKVASKRGGRQWVRLTALCLLRRSTALTCAACPLPARAATVNLSCRFAFATILTPLYALALLLSIVFRYALLLFFILFCINWETKKKKKRSTNQLWCNCHQNSKMPIFALKQKILISVLLGIFTILLWILKFFFSIFSILTI